jgi:hypothetical protein
VAEPGLLIPAARSKVQKPISISKMVQLDDSLVHLILRRTVRVDGCEQGSEGEWYLRAL